MSVATSEFLDKVIEATPDGKQIRKCLQCGTCSGVCPYGFAMDYPPRSLIAALRADDVFRAAFAPGEPAHRPYVGVHVRESPRL